MSRPSSLPRHPREMILALLRKSKTPLTAYSLLETLKPKGIKSAPIIYRALAELEKQGSVHKIKELASYVACACAHTHQHALTVLTVCGDCHAVKELHDHTVMQHIEALIPLGIHLKSRAVVELPITCDSCS